MRDRHRQREREIESEIERKTERKKEREEERERAGEKERWRDRISERGRAEREMEGGSLHLILSNGDIFKVREIKEKKEVKVKGYR